MVGATGMTIPRDVYYLKELSFSLSRSYGPGRYDRQYEEEANDYPIDYVRFTEQRNMAAFLDLVKQGRIDPAQLTTHRFDVSDAPAAYALLNQRGADRAGIILNYAATPAPPARFSLRLDAPKAAVPGAVGIGFIGAGAYAQSMLLPLLKDRPGVALQAVMTRGGSHARHAAQRFGFASVCTRAEDVLASTAVRLVFITTRHDSHADLAVQALNAGKHVWVEKPLALTAADLKRVWAAWRAHPESRLVVGFNRPFSPAAAWLLGRLPAASPRMLLYRVNAGFIPPDSWVHDPAQGGGRLLGEGCHFFDFLRHAAGANAQAVTVEPLAANRADLPETGNFSATVTFANGAVGQLLYTSQGAPAMGKEYFEGFAAQCSGALHDFRSATFFQGDRREELGRHAQDKGQRALLEAVLASVASGGSPPMSPEAVFESSILTLAAQASLLTRKTVPLADLRREILG
jgi:predicted dehydrogenase